jgi:hypothetical protein
MSSGLAASVCGDWLAAHHHPPEAIHRLFYRDKDVGRYIVARILRQNGANGLGVHPGLGRVPEAKRRQRPSMNVLRRLFQRGERQQGIARLGEQRIVGVEEERCVALDDEGAVLWHIRLF